MDYPKHAISAAHYLCDSGARHDLNLRKAVYAYNHANWHVRDVLHQADQYRTREPNWNDAPQREAALTAIRFARAQIGEPYVWGWDGTRDGGFDCSGLATAALRHRPRHRVRPSGPATSPSTVTPPPRSTTSASTSATGR